ncbi:VPLPA-CTERM sorting domain-containing protein [Methylomonas sp. MgM2]
MKKTQLSKAITLALSGAALTLGAIADASASTTYYNTFNAYSTNIVTDQACLADGSSCGFATDGWTNGAPSSGTWATPSHWTSASAPFGTVAKVVNWAAEISNAGDSLTISSQDSKTRYDIWADIDTAKGAWYDGAKGWGHNTDVGLFRSDVDTDVTINITSLQPVGSSETWTNFGVSIFTGMANNSWGHHGQWNNSTFTANNPLGGGSGTLIYLTHDATVDAVNAITFHATAGQVYSILLGGNSGGTNFDPHAGYSLNIATAPVPVPAAAWLFGGAIASLAGTMRRKRVMPI